MTPLGYPKSWELAFSRDQICSWMVNTSINSEWMGFHTWTVNICQYGSRLDRLDIEHDVIFWPSPGSLWRKHPSVVLEIVTWTRLAGAMPVPCLPVRVWQSYHWGWGMGWSVDLLETECGEEDRIQHSKLGNRFSDQATNSERFHNIIGEALMIGGFIMIGEFMGQMFVGRDFYGEVEHPSNAYSLEKSTNYRLPKRPWVNDCHLFGELGTPKSNGCYHILPIKMTTWVKAPLISDNVKYGPMIKIEYSYIDHFFLFEQFLHYKI